MTPDQDQLPPGAVAVDPSQLPPGATVVGQDELPPGAVQVEMPDPETLRKFANANKFLGFDVTGFPIYAAGSPAITKPIPGAPEGIAPSQGAVVPNAQPVLNPGAQLASGVYQGAGALFNLFGQATNLIDRAAQTAADLRIAPRTDFFKQMKEWAAQKEQEELRTAGEFTGGRTDFASKTLQGVGSGLIQAPLYAAAGEVLGPALGPAAVAGLANADKGVVPALTSAAQAAILGKTAQWMAGAGGAPLAHPGTALLTYGDLRANGADHETALANALGMTGLAAVQPGGLELKDPMETARNIGGAVKNLPENVIQALPPKFQRPLFPNRNPTEAEAMQFFLNRGAPVDAAAASGSRFLKGVKKATEATPLGAVVAEGAHQRIVEGVQNVAGQLLTEATPETPPDTFYQQFHAAADDPANARSVPTGETDDAGKPISEDMQIPVPVGVLHKTFQPIFDDMQFMPMADRSRNAAYSALQILLSKDYVPARQAEIALSGIKQAIREGGGHQQALAKFVAPKLQGLIDRAVGDIAGEDTAKALQQGRISAATQAGADWLKEGFQKSMAEGGFNRQDWLWNRWLNLSEEAKRTMYTPKQLADLNNFFLGAKKIFENINPSGTAFVTGIQALLAGTALASPVSSGASILTTGALAKLLNSKFGVRLLTEGLGSFAKDMPRTQKITPELLRRQLLLPGSPRTREITRQLQKIVGQEPAEK